MSGTSPTLTNAGTKAAESAATRTSHAQASESPAPAAGPFTAASTGFSRPRRPSTWRFQRSRRQRGDVAVALAQLGEVLADAEAAPVAGEDDGAHVGVARPPSSAPAKAACVAPLNALSTSGRLSVIVSTAPSRVVSTSAIALLGRPVRVR